MIGEPTEFDFSRCDAVLEMKLRFSEIGSRYQQTTDLEMIVELDSRKLGILLVGVSDLRIPTIHGSFQFGEFAVVSKATDGLESIRYLAFDELTGFRSFAKDIKIYWQ